MAVKVYISVGSNADDGQNIIRSFFSMLESAECFESISKSNIYSTSSISGDGKMYMNAVFSAITNSSKLELNNWCKETERTFGRGQTHDGVVVLDLDLVVYGDEILRPRDAARDYFLIGFNQLTR